MGLEQVLKDEDATLKCVFASEIKPVALWDTSSAIEYPRFRMNSMSTHRRYYLALGRILYFVKQELVCIGIRCVNEVAV